MPVYRIKSRRGRVFRVEAVRGEDFKPPMTPEEEVKAHLEEKARIREAPAAPEPEPAEETAPAMPPVPDAGKHTCADCGFVATTVQGLGAHRRARHGG